MVSTAQAICFIDLGFYNDNDARFIDDLDKWAHNFGFSFFSPPISIN